MRSTESLLWNNTRSTVCANEFTNRNTGVFGVRRRARDKTPEFNILQIIDAKKNRSTNRQIHFHLNLSIILTCSENEVFFPSNFQMLRKKMVALHKQQHCEPFNSKSDTLLTHPECDSTSSTNPVFVTVPNPRAGRNMNGWLDSLIGAPDAKESEQRFLPSLQPAKSPSFVATSVMESVYWSIIGSPRPRECVCDRTLQFYLAGSVKKCRVS